MRGDAPARQSPPARGSRCALSSGRARRGRGCGCERRPRRALATQTLPTRSVRLRWPASRRCVQPTPGAARSAATARGASSRCDRALAVLPRAHRHWWLETARPLRARGAKCRDAVRDVGASLTACVSESFLRRAAICDDAVEEASSLGPRVHRRVAYWMCRACQTITSRNFLLIARVVPKAAAQRKRMGPAALKIARMTWACSRKP